MQNEIWVTKDGQHLKVSEMTEQHAKNVLNYLLKERREEQEIILENSASIY